MIIDEHRTVLIVPLATDMASRITVAAATVMAGRA
jgi:hypothetical protein